MIRTIKPWLAGGTAALFVAVLVSASPVASGAPVVRSANASVEPTIQEWNWDTVDDDPGEHAAVAAALPLFEKQYHVKVVDTEMTLEEQWDKLPLALASKSSAPTVTETNEGFGSMGRLVTDNELLNLASFNQTYHFSKVGALPLQFNSFTPDGKIFGSGNVYGIPADGSLVGIYYNKKILAEVGAKIPTDFAILQADLPIVHKHGIIPMAYSGGQPTAYQPTHTLYTLANQFVPAAQQNAFVFHTGKSPTIDSPGFVKAATVYQQWANDGYFSPGYQGLSDAQALTQFTSGKAAFFLEGNWYSGPIESALGANAGFWIPPTVTGGPGEGWSIPTYSPYPKLAAEWISMMLSPTIQAVLMKNGDVPLVSPGPAALATASPLVRASAKGWATAVKKKSVVAYLDYAEPKLSDQEMAGIEELLANKITPAGLMKSLQSDYTTYWSSSRS